MALTTQSLFHLSGGLLGNGSLVLPGNWGRVIQAVGWAHPQAAKEMMFEEARLRVAAEKPSRLASCFAFPTLEEAQQFRPYGFEYHVLYEVVLEQPHHGFYVFDASLVTLQGEVRPYWADAYWQGVAEIARIQPKLIREVLTLSPLRIVRRV